MLLGQSKWAQTGVTISRLSNTIAGEIRSERFKSNAFALRCVDSERAMLFQCSSSTTLYYLSRIVFTLHDDVTTTFWINVKNG